jgi:protein TonB
MRSIRNKIRADNKAMGFSESSSEGRRKELRIFRWVLLGATIAAVGMHLSSVPLLMRFVNGVFGELDLDAIEEPIEVIVVEEAVPEPESPVTPPPPSEEATDNEPAASALEDSAPPLRTTDSIIPTPPTADSIETVPTESAIATETGIEGGEGAAGDANTIGLFRGDGSTEGDPTAPVGPPNVQQQEPVERQPVQEVARARPPATRRVACNPCSTPDYPLSQQREAIQGQPVINIVFDENGNVVQAVVERTSGIAALDQAALQEALTNWRFADPYGLGGQISVEVPFVIEGTDQFDAVQAAGQREAIELPVQQSIVPVTPATAGTPPTPEPPPPDPTEAEGAPAVSPLPALPVDAAPSPETTPPDTTESPSNNDGETDDSPPATSTGAGSGNPALDDEAELTAPSAPPVAPAVPSTVEPVIPQASPQPQSVPTPAPESLMPSSESPSEPANETN